MARSLSDDPVKLRNELLGISRRAHEIEKKLRELERQFEGEPDVAVGDELHELVEWAKSCPTAPLELDDSEGIDF